MTTMNRCPSCRGFVPGRITTCPNCGATEPEVAPGAIHVPFWLRAVSGSAVAMTMMACYGDIDGPYDTDDAGTTYGTSSGTTTGTSGDTGTTSDSTTCDTDCSSTGSSSGDPSGSSSGSDTGSSSDTEALDSSSGGGGSGSGTDGDPDPPSPPPSRD